MWGESPLFYVVKKVFVLTDQKCSQGALLVLKPLVILKKCTCLSELFLIHNLFVWFYKFLSFFFFCFLSFEFTVLICSGFFFYLSQDRLVLSFRWLYYLISPHMVQVKGSISLHSVLVLHMYKLSLKTKKQGKNKVFFSQQQVQFFFLMFTNRKNSEHKKKNITDLSTLILQGNQSYSKCICLSKFL